ncbi:MAG: bifunctional diaminohydroxyphosphoribosylaminopyrimidine deaminase/5-amino-6-(5-phosphoribosylamino)uracil reductase RibD [Gemmatimonadaceae bacterium]|nr:bifunctional diaminohydroxyphosphoribosylaminopyrimidine deaminase/5-amino-6-(5-phosphoribosylamino)uracil reductase RibD [Gemmatimonadaceae bacterium]
MTDVRQAREDRRWMRRALALARRGWGRTAPNPLVGAVLVREGRVVGAGWHAEYGGPHAEAMALAAAGDRARGATAYVTLEPCAHYGKTPPCADALIRAGVARVVVAIPDPNPVAAGGAAALRDAGVPVDVGVEADAATWLNAPFLFAARGATRPFVTLKLAVSVEGAIAPASRTAQWLTGPLARREVHRMRAHADAIAVGIGTALADNPALTVREVAPPRVPPVRVVFDRRGRLPLGSALAASARDVPVWVVASPAAADTTVAALEGVGVAVLRCDDLGAALATLRGRGVRHLLVEGGSGIAEALLTGGFVDRVAIFQSSVRLGAGAVPAFGRLGSTLPAGWRPCVNRRVGADVLTVYAPAPR